MHTGAWVAWVTMVMVVALATTNPWYLALLLLAITLVALLAPRTSTGPASLRALVLFGVVILCISVAVATINGNYGDHILFTVPGPEAPDWLGGLRLGGPVSAEGLAAASIRGGVIFCVFLTFGVFSAAVPAHRVLRSTPAALFHASLILTIGLTLLPATVEDLRRIREMRILRGASGGIRDLPGLVVPAVVNGLERSMLFAEAMEARGYAARSTPSVPARLAAAVSAPLFIAAAWWWFYGGPPGFAAAAAIAGLACLAWWILASRRAHRTTSMVDEPLPLSQSAGITISAAGVLAALTLRATGTGSLAYNPFAGLATPGVSVAGVALVALCAWPAFVLSKSPEPQTTNAAQPLSEVTS